MGKLGRAMTSDCHLTKNKNEFSQMTKIHVLSQGLARKIDQYMAFGAGT